MHRGCSDDGFEYFRSWVVMQGRDATHAAIEDPLARALAQPPELAMGEAERDAEVMSYAPFEAYEQMTGRRLLRRWPSRRAEPSREQVPKGEIMSHYAEFAAHREQGQKRA